MGSNQPLMQSISAAARPRIRDFRAPNLSNTAWAWAGLLYWHGPLMHSISASSLATLSPQSNSLSPACEGQDGGDASPQDLANTAWSLSRLYSEDGPLLAAIAAAALAKLRLAPGSFSLQDLANTVWSVSRCRIVSVPLLDAIAAAAIRTISAYGNQNLANIAWSFAAIRCRHGGALIHAISREADQRRHSYTPSMPCTDMDHRHGLAWAAWRASSVDQVSWVVGPVATTK